MKDREKDRRSVNRSNGQNKHDHGVKQEGYLVVVRNIFETHIPKDAGSDLYILLVTVITALPFWRRMR